MLVDDGISMIGTVNFDNRSFRLNFEITSIVAETAFTAEVENMLLKDIENSEHVKNYRLEAQSLWERLKAHGSVLLAPSIDNRVEPSTSLLHPIPLWFFCVTSTYEFPVPG